MWLLFYNFFKQVQYIANISRTIKIPENKRLIFDADYLFAGGEKGIAKVFCKQLSRQNICIFHADMQNEIKKMSLIRLLVCAYYFILKFSNIS